MKIIDLNGDREKVILLIHPMLSSAEGMKLAIADHMGKEFRYIIPDLSAHGKASKEIYMSAENESEVLYQYLKNNHIEEVMLAFGASIGGVILLRLLNRKDIKIQHAVFEGCSLWQNAGFLDFIVRNIFIYKHRKAIANRESAVKKITKMYGESAVIMADRFIQMDEQSIHHIFRDCAYVILPNLAKEEQKRCLFLYGSKDFDLRCARKILPKKYPYARLKIWEGQGHCTKITADSYAYCKMLKNEMENQA